MGKRHRGLKRELGGPPQAPEEADRARSKDGPTTLKGGVGGGGAAPGFPPPSPRLAEGRAVRDGEVPDPRVSALGRLGPGRRPGTSLSGAFRGAGGVNR